MTDPSNTIPSKCARCQSTIRGTLVCDDCKALNPAAAVMDYFTLLGLPESFEIDPVELRKKYLSLSRHAHPDFHAQEDEDVQALHMKVASSLNEAYRTLKDPASRAAYLLERFGGKSAAEDKSVPDGFLGTMMMLQEELQDALADGDQGELDRLIEVLQVQRDGLMRRIEQLFADHQEAIACQAVTTDLLEEIRKQLNAMSYVRKLLSQARPDEPAPPKLA